MWIAVIFRAMQFHTAKMSLNCDHGEFDMLTSIYRYETNQQILFEALSITALAAVSYGFCWVYTYLYVEMLNMGSLAGI
jgi:hypothetical protein